MIEALFAMLIGIITFFVTGVIIIGLLLLPLIFKGGWVVYLLFCLLILSSWFDRKEGNNNENKRM